MGEFHSMTGLQVSIIIKSPRILIILFSVILYCVVVKFKISEGKKGKEKVKRMN